MLFQTLIFCILFLYNECFKIPQMTKILCKKSVRFSSYDQIKENLRDFMDEYTESNLKAKVPLDKIKSKVNTFIEEVQKSIQSPFKFSSFHKAIREPFDYYKWGNDFIRPLIIMEDSKLFGLNAARKILELSEKKSNVVILSNHQTEVDPQAISILLENSGMESLAEKIVYVAGHKVTNDPVAIPFSMGRNLICIHSKKHIRNPPELFNKKQADNIESMKTLGEMFSRGGNIFWVAPSGGRDRPNENGQFEVSKFDPKVLDMFKILSMNTDKELHYFPMAMFTHQLIPPPNSTSSELGEVRSAKRGRVSVQFLDETNGTGGLKDKAFCQSIQDAVVEAYNKIQN